MLNFRQLTTFVTVAELGSFTKAAKKLYMTQPAISWQIKSLETELGLTLLERGDRQVTLTEAGRIFYTDAKRLTNLYEKLMYTIEEYKGLGKGTLKIGASTIPGEYLLPYYIGQFKGLFPEINITLSISDTRDIVDKLLMDSIHLGVIGAKPSEDKLIFRPLIEDELILIAGARHPWAEAGAIPFEDLVQAKFVFREEGSGTRMVIEEELAAKGVDVERLEIEMELGSTRAVITAVAADLGVSFVSRLAVTDALSLGHVREIQVQGLDLKRHIYLALHAQRTLSPLANAFLEFIAEAVVQGPHGTGPVHVKERQLQG